jgi:hypothetical protein
MAEMLLAEAAARRWTRPPGDGCGTLTKARCCELADCLTLRLRGS